MTDAPAAPAAYDDSMNVDTPDYTDSEDPNTTASSVVDGPADGRKRRSEATQLRKSVFGKKHGALNDTKVGSLTDRQLSQHLPLMCGRTESHAFSSHSVPYCTSTFHCPL